MKGFDDKLLTLFEIVFARLLSFRGRVKEDGLPDNIDDGRFDACVEMLLRKYDNSGMDAASMATSVRVRCICPGSWSATQKVSSSLYCRLAVGQGRRQMQWCSWPHVSLNSCVENWL